MTHSCRHHYWNRLIAPLRRLASLASLVMLIGLLPLVANAADPAPIDFNRDIRPILSDKCFFCHGPEEENRGADLRLDTHEGLLGEETGEPAVVEGDAEASLLIERILAEDEDERMPPVESGKKLSAEEIELLKRWIDEGAVWQQHWAYVPPEQHEVPTIADDRWSRNWIDKFVLKRLKAERLTPAEDTDRVTLVRRLYFDILGLPPTPQQVEAFVKSDDPQAYERLVDELLASPHFGERMAMYWLDLVRYADTVGYHGDQDHNISPYRDYVIDSFNDNKPFDRFTAEQLAGDLLPNSTIDDKIASGYNRMLQTSHEGGVQAKEYLAIYAADRVRNFSGVWLGGTVGCAQCHDHKYDPYTMKDFYSLVAFFSDIDETSHFTNATNAVPTRRLPEIKVHTRRERERLAQLDEQIAQLEQKLATGNTGAPAKIGSTEQLQKQLAGAKQQRDQLAAAKRAIMVTVPVKPRTIRVLPRGNWLDDSGPIVEPAVPEFLAAEETDAPSTANEQDATDQKPRLNRLDLAHWLFDMDTGVGKLTARVQVNRFWYLFFGTGIAKVLDDFGGQGQPPVHPELLDNLAIEFAESGWDIKHMVKLLVMSRAYRQSSVAGAGLLARDPYNQLFARQSRYRLPAESVRDTALSISGLLVKDLGGASVKPYQPAGYYRHLNFPQRRYYQHNDQRQWRRGVYMHWQRMFLHPALKAMDAPSREECTAERPRSNTPLSALVLLNDPTFVEAARVFAERIIREGGDTTERRIEFAFRKTVSRLPDKVEANLLARLLEQSRANFTKNPAAAEKLLSVGLAERSDDIDAAELASWTSVARAIFNLNEAISRN